MSHRQLSDELLPSSSVTVPLEHCTHATAAQVET